jgi:uncharacterized FlaG/YvyC family protein
MVWSNAMTIETMSLDRGVKTAESPFAAATTVATSAPATVKAPAASVATPANVDDVNAAVTQLQTAISNGPNPDFKLDYLSGLSVVTVRSTITGQVVFQLPDTRALQLARMIKDGASVGSVGLFTTTA